MNCHLCDREAVGRCYTCGGLFCDQHGHIDCARCETAIAAGDPRPDRVSALPLGKTGRSGWWRPQAAEDYNPPACYECKGLARRLCRNCGSLYCPEHAGRGELCAGCARSSFMGILVLVWIVVLIGVLMLWAMIAK